MNRKKFTYPNRYYLFTAHIRMHLFTELQPGLVILYGRRQGNDEINKLFKRRTKRKLENKNDLLFLIGQAQKEFPMSYLSDSNLKTITYFGIDRLFRNLNKDLALEYFDKLSGEKKAIEDQMTVQNNYVIVFPFDH